MNEFTLHSTQRDILRMAAWYDKQPQPTYFPQSLSWIDAYILLTLDKKRN